MSTEVSKYVITPRGKNGVPLVNGIAQWSHSFYLGSYSCLASSPGHPQILSHSCGEKSATIFLHSYVIKSGSGPGTRVTLANCRQSLNTACLVMHSPYLRHLNERLADGGQHASAAKQSLCCLLCSACLHNC